MFRLARILCILILPALTGLAAPPSQAAKNLPGFDALAQQAVKARDAGRMDEAFQLYKRAVTIRPEWADGWWALGTIGYDQDKYELCADAFAHFVALKPDVSPGWILCGVCEYSLREYKDALQSLLRAERTGFNATPELAKAGRLHLALLLNKFGDWERAINLLDAQIRAAGRSDDFIAAAGIAGLREPWLPTEVPEADRDLVARLGDAVLTALELNATLAKEKFEALVQDYPKSASVHFRFGSTLMKSDPERGLAEMKKALALDPKHVPALVTMSLQSLMAGDTEAAEAYGRRAVQTAPDNFASHFALGRAFMAQHKLPEAVEQLELAVKQAPDSPNAHFTLATAYAQAGRKDDAERERAEFQRLKKLVNSPVKSQ